jgi:arylsulfatase A-like enzyme
MSAYTGRYVRSHGSTWNGMPLRVGERTIGDHLKKNGIQSVLVGKTHMVADAEGMAWLGIDPNSEIGVRVSECGFIPFERDDGLHPNSKRQRWSSYDDYLEKNGYTSDNPWGDFANSGLSENGDLLSGWLLKNSRLPANIPEEHSETAYMTNRAIDFMSQASENDQPWLCHLSYIKPHWPYIVPSPYHKMYSEEDINKPIRSDKEKRTNHPLLRAYQNARVSRCFSRDEVRDHVIPAYMGLIKQLDDNLGRLFQWMDKSNLSENTVIIFSSDHGDYLGDHWMGDKDFYHEMAVKVPLIIHDPRKVSDKSRGSVKTELVEMIDLAPTILSFFGCAPKPHIIEGRDLTPLLEGTAGFSRNYVISEHDYHWSEMAKELNQKQDLAHTKMIFDGRWKYIRCEGFEPILFDLLSDPHELVDLASSMNSIDQEARSRLEAALESWAMRHHSRTTGTEEILASQKKAAELGILIGFWDEKEFEDKTGKKFENLKPVGKKEK